MTSSASSSISIESIREQIEILKIKKQSLEMEGTVIIQELMDTKDGTMIPAGIDTPLIDTEGYPRNDIDLYRVRTIRQRLAIITTDRTALQQQIETLLYQLPLLSDPNKAIELQHEQQRRQQPKSKPYYCPKTKKWMIQNSDGTQIHSSSISTTTTTSTATTTNTNNIPVPSPESSSSEQQQQVVEPLIIVGSTTKGFARVNTVENNSPASYAGLQTNDEILQFGTIQDRNDFYTLSDIVVRAASNNTSIQVIVKRRQIQPQHQQQQVSTSQQQQQQQEQQSQYEQVSLTLRPRPWDGRGLLGCHILPN